MTANRRPLTALAIGAFVCGLASACSDEPPPAQEARVVQPVEVRVAVAATGSAPRRLRSLGTLLPLEEVTVAAEVEGRLVAVLHDVGDSVIPGEPLAHVDDRDLTLERDQRRRAVEESLARLGLTELGEQVDVDRLPLVERARIAAENAKARLDRATSLRDRTPPLVSVQHVEDLHAAWEVAERDRDAAALTARAQVAEARTRRAQLEVVEDRLRRVVVATPGGVRPALPGTGAAPHEARDAYLVAERHVSAGDYVDVGDPLFRLVDCDPLLLRLTVPERRMAGVEPGLRALVTVAASSQPVEGRVARVRPEVDPRTRTFLVDVLVPNPGLRLAAGAFATAELDLGEDAGVVLVPETAVRSFAGVRKVFLVEDGKAVERPVTLGRRVDSRIEVTRGLAPGDTFLVEPPAGIVTGTPVRAAAEVSSGGAR